MHNSFSYHLTPGGLDDGIAARCALGCTVFPGGIGNTELQLQAMAELRPDAYVGTPSFLRILLEKAAETGIALPLADEGLLGGEAFPPSLRDWLRRARHRRPTRATPPPTSASSPTRPRRAKAWCSTKA